MISSNMSDPSLQHACPSAPGSRNAFPFPEAGGPEPEFPLLKAGLPPLKPTQGNRTDSDAHLA